MKGQLAHPGLLDVAIHGVKLRRQRTGYCGYGLKDGAASGDLYNNTFQMVGGLLDKHFISHVVICSFLRVRKDDYLFSCQISKCVH